MYRKENMWVGIGFIASLELDNFTASLNFNIHLVFPGHYPSATNLPSKCIFGILFLKYNICMPCFARKPEKPYGKYLITVVKTSCSQQAKV